MAEVYVKGLAALQKELDTLAPRIERNIMRGAMRAGMNTVKPVAQSNVRSVTGLLARGLKVFTRARAGAVWASLRVTGPHAYVAKWVEFGTAAHVIAAKVGRWLAFGDVVRKAVRHPGSRPKPFMRPALDSQAQTALVAAGEYVKKRLTKEGLNVVHIQVEGDE